jgi:ketosteroid isomerase-like protein
MSENLDAVRSIYADWERGDFLTSFEWAHTEVEFIVADGPEPGRWTGLADLQTAFRERMSAWDDYRFIADEIKDLDDERVLALNRRSGRGKASGLDIGQTQSAGMNLFCLREGKVTNLIVYWDRQRGLADLGLAGESDCA